MLIQELKKHDKFVIYGAQVIAFGAYTAIKGLTGRQPEFFVVGNASGILRDGLNGNLSEIEGIPVKPIEECPKDIFIVVAVTELVQKDVLPMLQEKGYSNIFALGQHEEHLLMSEYYDSIGMFPTLEKLRGKNAQDNSNEANSFGIIGDGNDEMITDSTCTEDESKIAEESARKLDLNMYEVGNHRDNVLSSRPPLRAYEHPIQAGAALSDKRIADILDNIGINISEKNKQYCEMTASYWIWKNKKHGWKGIEHYRRHLLVRPELIGDDIDALLPLPYICYPNEMYQFRRFISEDVKNALLEGLKAVHPNEYDEYYKILMGQYQYTYNMVCARNEVFDAYCKWFFEITEYIETLSDKYPEIKETRALSYVAEVLTNIYFMTNQDKLNIYHVEKRIFV